MFRTYDAWKTTEPDWNADEFPPCEQEPEPTEEEYERMHAEWLKSAGATRKR